MTYLDSILPKHTSPPVSNNSQESGKKKKDHEPTHDFVLSQREAEAASQDMAVCGEEDPGEGLEFLVADELEK